MRVLALSRYTRMGASSRLRLMQYHPWLESAGIEVVVSPLFSDEYVSGLQHNRRHIGDVAMAYVTRLKTLLHGGKFDLIWIEKEVLPWLPAWIELMLLSKGVPYVLDYDDAFFHFYDLHSQPVVRWLLSGKHPTLMRKSALVIAGNNYLADFARNAGAERVEIIPTVVDLDRYDMRRLARSDHSSGMPCIGWIGQRASALNLMKYKEIFYRLSDDGRACFSAIGIDAQSLGLPMKSVAWTEETEVANIADLDIGIMPLVDAPFERGKCGYKLIQYMACGLPVVASPVGVNSDIVEHGVNGFLADTAEEWVRSLSLLLEDKELRRRMGHAGRLKVEKEFCIQVTGPRLAGLCKEIATINNIEK
ncbi:glycosyltransferase family 4 protein [Chlorobium sp. BLA1]|nr:glycosyltransferase family 4 protein [Candidatus Chlorobium masyuteum]